MVGASLACALSGSGYAAGIIDSHLFDGNVRSASYDDRSVALAYGSRRILEGIGLWTSLARHAIPIRTIHVSERGHFGATRLRSHDEGVEALGYIIQNRLLGEVLHHQLLSQADVEFIAPTTVTAISHKQDHISVCLEQPSGETLELRTRLLVGADGTVSGIRQQLGIEEEKFNYNQTAIVTNVSPQREHYNVAYERFTPSGPLALLPMSDDRCSLVWTHPEPRAEDILNLRDAEFIRHLQAAFGFRMGRFMRVGRRTAYPLSLTRSKALTTRRAVLVGNAANTVHPVAGQGFNLALRDIALLAELLVRNRKQLGDPGAHALLHEYTVLRQADIARVTGFTDSLARLFVNPFPPLAHGRGVALSLFDKLPSLRHQLARRSMGLTGKLSRLSCGLPLEAADT